VFVVGVQLLSVTGGAEGRVAAGVDHLRAAPLIQGFA
jgi:hypothetical protein